MTVLDTLLRFISDHAFQLLFAMFMVVAVAATCISKDATRISKAHTRLSVECMKLRQEKKDLHDKYMKLKGEMEGLHEDFGIEGDDDLDDSSAILQGKYLAALKQAKEKLREKDAVFEKLKTYTETTLTKFQEKYLQALLACRDRLREKQEKIESLERDLFAYKSGEPTTNEVAVDSVEKSAHHLE